MASDAVMLIKNDHRLLEGLFEQARSEPLGVAGYQTEPRAGSGKDSAGSAKRNDKGDARTRTKATPRTRTTSPTRPATSCTRRPRTPTSPAARP
jgi:hypothetical protein